MPERRFGLGRRRIVRGWLRARSLSPTTFATPPRCVAGARIGAPLMLVRSCVHRRARRSDEMSLNLAIMLRESALAYPDKPVALYDGGRLSYAQLDALSDRFATGHIRSEERRVGEEG